MLRSPQHRTDTRDELSEAERLGHVIIGAGLETTDLVDLLIACGEHDDGRSDAARAHVAADVEAVLAGQHHVEHDQLGRRPKNRCDAGRPVGGEFDLEAFEQQLVVQREADARFVRDHQNPRWHVSALRAWK